MAIRKNTMKKNYFIYSLNSYFKQYNFNIVFKYLLSNCSKIEINAIIKILLFLLRVYE